MDDDNIRKDRKEKKKGYSNMITLYVKKYDI